MEPRQPERTFSSTESLSTRLNSWKIMPMWRRISRKRLRLSVVRSTPSSTTLPASGSTNRLMHRRSVDLPEPLSPSTATTSCAWTWRFHTMKSHLPRVVGLPQALYFEQGAIVVIRVACRLHRAAEMPTVAPRPSASRFRQGRATLGARPSCKAGELRVVDPGPWPRSTCSSWPRGSCATGRTPRRSPAGTGCS